MESTIVARRKSRPAETPRDERETGRGESGERKGMVGEDGASAPAGTPGKPFSASFAQLVFESRLAGRPGADWFEISRPLLVELLRPMFRALRFDPQWYQSAYPDIAAACRAGTLSDVRAHYCEFGFFEHRLPCFVRVDEDFYASEYPDIGIAIAEGRVASPQGHFETFGFREGRLPWRGWRFSDLVAGG